MIIFSAPCKTSITSFFRISLKGLRGAIVSTIYTGRESYIIVVCMCVCVVYISLDVTADAYIYIQVTNEPVHDRRHSKVAFYYIVSTMMTGIIKRRKKEYYIIYIYIQVEIGTQQHGWSFCVCAVYNI